jgi:suppressor of ftsI
MPVRNDTTRTLVHVHVHDSRWLSINGRPHYIHGWQDTASIPTKGQIVIRTRFTDYIGETVLHCHILDREDDGMMAILEIVQ